MTQGQKTLGGRKTLENGAETHGPPTNYHPKLDTTPRYANCEAKNTRGQKTLGGRKTLENGAETRGPPTNYHPKLDTTPRYANCEAKNTRGQKTLGGRKTLLSRWSAHPSPGKQKNTRGHWEPLLGVIYY